MNSIATCKHIICWKSHVFWFGPAAHWIYVKFSFDSKSNGSCKLQTILWLIFVGAFQQKEKMSVTANQKASNFDASIFYYFSSPEKNWMNL